MNYMFLIVIMVVMFGMMFWQSKKAKQQQAERQDFRANLQPGTEVITIGGVIGKVVSVDTEYEEIVITNYDPRLYNSARHWQLNLFNLSAADEEEGKYTLIHEPTKELKQEE